MDLPWVTRGTPDGAAYVMGSRFELRSAWRSPAFLVHSLRIWRQARRSPGILGLSLRAHPVSGVFWTLSAWTDEAALRAFAHADPHRTIIKRVRPWTKSATFRFWETASLSPAGLWADAERRISAT
jgi:heme-degrading monooxygenase HmoA